MSPRVRGRGPVVVAALFAAPAPTAAGPPDFKTAIAPVLERACVRCHHAGNAKGDVSLATAADLIAGEHVVPGKPDESGLVALVSPGADGERPRMPKDGKPLTPAEVDTLKEWIAAGAVWPGGLELKGPAKADPAWWSLRPLADVAPPRPAGLPPAWVRNPIDRFVFAELSDKGLAPNPPADPRALARRLTFDLTGLPPTPERVEAFAAAPTPAAYERLVEELLASPAYGERWGRHWLDVVRFGESNGYERNVLIDTLWPFRDYVIDSFNRDKPFDRLVTEHLAGDTTGDPAAEIGTAFLVCGPYDDVGNQDAAQAAVIRANHLDDMIRAAGEAFLGMTVGCARCHDHKFDPITQADYYRLSAAVAGVTHGTRVLAPAAAQREREAKLAALRQERAPLAAERAKLAAAVTSRAQTWGRLAEARWVRPPADPVLTEDRFPAVEARYVRLNVRSRSDAPDKVAGYAIDEFEVWTAGPDPRNVALAANGGRAAGESRPPPGESGIDAYGPGLAIDGKPAVGWLAAGPTLTVTLAKPERVGRVAFSGNRRAADGPQKYSRPFVGDYALEVSTDGKTWTEVAGSADRKPPTPAHRPARLFALCETPAERDRLAALDRQLAEIDRAVAAVPPLPAWWAGKFNPTPEPTHVFTGGDPQKKAAAVTAASPSFPAPAGRYALPADAPEADRRAALARWVVAPDNPLPPRVLANRVWHYHFGTGIVDTPSDFGVMGGRPTHPELLDWLSNYVRVSGWRLKPLHRLIVTSETYRQSSKHRPGAAAVDGDARLLWRFPPRRLSGEEVRDSMLAVAGKLGPTRGGPGFRLYQFFQDNVCTYVPLDAPGPESYRRAVYHQTPRAARVDVLTDFDCPDPAAASPRRSGTTTPLQALTLFNHKFTLDMADALTDRLRREAGADPGAQLKRAFALAYGRPPTADELADAGALAATHGLRAFCRALLNSNEFLYVD